MKAIGWITPATLALMLALQASAAAEPKAGNVAASTNVVEGILDGGGTRVLRRGNEVYSQELIRTGEGGVAQLELLDKTNLSVGPKSEVRLDKFVYDPEGGTGAVIVKVSRGAFRFITGTQDHRNYTIQTPQANLGVRGTTFDVVITDDELDVHLVDGGLEVSTLIGELFELTPTANRLKVSSTGSSQGPTYTPATTSILTFALLKAVDDVTGSVGNRASLYGGPIATPNNIIARLGTLGTSAGGTAGGAGSSSSTTSSFVFTLGGSPTPTGIMLPVSQ